MGQDLKPGQDRAGTFPSVPVPVAAASEPAKLGDIRLRSSGEENAQFLAGGLSTPHISPQTPINSPELSKIRSSSLASWSDGALFQVSQSGESLPQVGGGKRDVVGGFTRAARLRALRMLAQTDKKSPNCFYTLTWSDEYYDQVCVDEVGPRDAGIKVKRDLDAWGKRLVREYPDVGLFWRVETIDRKSGKFIGKIYPHVHGFFWGLEDIDKFKKWLSLNWAETVAEKSDIDPLHVRAGTQVQQPRDWRAVMAYASKMVYATKPGDSNLKGLGRWWGAINRDAIPWSPVEAFDPGSRVAMMMIRSMRKYLDKQSRFNNPWLRKSKSLTIFTDNPEKWVMLAVYYQGLYSDQNLPM